MILMFSAVFVDASQKTGTVTDFIKKKKKKVYSAYFGSETPESH